MVGSLRPKLKRERSIPLGPMVTESLQSPRVGGASAIARVSQSADTNDKAEHKLFRDDDDRAIGAA